MPNQHQLGYVQAVISRLSDHSKTLKAAAIAIVTTLLGIATKGGQWQFGVLSLYAIISIAGLDAYYLASERRYRKLYELATARLDDNDWSMNSGKASLREVLGATGSPSIFIPYGFSMSIAVLTTILLF